MLMNQKMKILIAYDGSSHADAAIDDLRRAGLPREAEAVVVSVADVWSPPAPPSEYEAAQSPRDDWTRLRAQWFSQQEARAREEAQNLARAASQRALSYFPSWEVQTEVRLGASAWELIRKADDWRADLLAVGSQGRSALGRLLLGSVSQKVVTEARCSVRVARNSVREPDAPARIIIGVDGSGYSDAAADEVARRHWPKGSVVKVVSVVRLPFTPNEETRSLPDSYYSQLEKAETGKAQTAITSAVARLKQSGITQPEIESEIILGDAREKILDEAAQWEADLIVLGSRGLGGFKRFLLGSVAQGVAAYAPCSVEIIRSSQTDGAGQKT
jgi:nucleotide-binding universal stress UspA family protein